MAKKVNRIPILVSKHARRVSFFYGIAAGLLIFLISTAFLLFGVKNNPKSALIRITPISIKIFPINVFWFVVMEVLTILTYYIAARLAMRKTTQANIGIRTGVWGGLICGISGLLLCMILMVSIIVVFLTWHPAPASPQTLEHTALGMVLQPYPRIPIGPFNFSRLIMLIQVILELVFLLILGIGYYLLIMGLIPGLIGGLVASWTGKSNQD